MVYHSFPKRLLVRPAQNYISNIGANGYLLEPKSSNPMRSLFTLVLLTILSGAIAQPGWTPESMIKFKRVAGTDISADGKLVAYTVAPPVMEGDQSEFRQQVWVASTDGKWNTQFTHSDKSCSSPKFSPDGTYLSFISSRGKDGKAQVWVMRVAGGEAEVITSAKGGVSQFAWSPDSKRIAFAMMDTDSEEEEKMKKEKKDWNIMDTWKYNHLYVVALARNEKGERTSKRLTKGDFHVTAFDWSRDGKTIAFSHQQNPLADAWPSSDISLVPSDSGALRPLVSGKGMDTNPLYSPDGQWIAFVSDGGKTRWASSDNVYVVPAAGGEPKKLSDTPDMQPALVRWSTDGKELFFSETDHTSNRLFALPLAGKPRVITTGAGSYGGYSISGDGKMYAFIHQTPEVAPEVFSTASIKFEPKKLSDANKDFPKLAMGKTEIVSWKSKDGRMIEGLLTYPVNYKQGRKYPLILNIHGGPAGVFMQTFTGAGSVYPIQAFAQAGYAVLRPNPRGSSGYGIEFRQANTNDWGFGDYDDDQTGVDKVIDMGIAHPDSLVICGWSYGGYMTSFTVTKTNRFKAASLGAPVTNLMSFNGTADIPGFIPDYFGGEFWDRMEVYQKHSAMFNIKNVKTPSQVIHGERDARVPPEQGYQFYAAMKRLGVPSEMITYPRTPHGPQEPKFIQDIGERVIAWFDKYLGKKSRVIAAK
jgi:dipeptidyl aminopeptidase/acylaminoacyl peptidase